LYTSGSTGKPKGIVHTCGGYTVQAYWTAKLIFDLWDDDIFWSTADVGWITGHTYSCYGPLLNDATMLIFEGVPNYPEPDRWCHIIEKYGVTTFYTAPTAIRMFEKELGKVKEKLNTLQLIASVGEPINEEAWRWFFKEVGKEKCPLLDTWWQTETGGVLITSLPGIGPFKPTFAGIPFPGVQVDILDNKGKPVKTNKKGNLVIKPPFTPGMLRGVYKNPKKYKNTYFGVYGDKIYFTSDVAYRDKNGLMRIVGRADDVIKVAGHRISTGEMENIIDSDKRIAECAVVGIPHEIKGETPIVFVVLKPKKKVLEEQVVKLIVDGIGKIAKPSKVFFVKDLPKTRSGKIMRRILRRLFTEEPLGDLSTLANPQSVEQIKKIIK
jgi:acetyl-CoA synthetase